jgi:hypothetical protein
MKKILFLMLLIPTLSFSQVSGWRSGNYHSQPQQSVPRVQQPNVSGWRTQTEPIRPGQPIPEKPLVRTYRPTIINPYGLYYGTWGWYQPYPYLWYDNYGWRHRSEVRIYENGRRDTIEKIQYFTAGIGHTNNKQASFWGAIGGSKGYFILDYTMSYDIDHNQYFPYGLINNVDFPLSKNDFIKQNTLYLGGGKRFGKLGVHGMIGFGHEEIRYQGKDDLGGISFPKSNAYFTTFKFGIIRDFKFFTLKLDRDPIRNFNQISIGLNNK